jgi:hypothetical protein
MRINRLKRYWAVATRYDKPAVRYEATVLVAAINEWLWPHGRTSLQLTLCRETDRPAKFVQPFMLIRTGAVDKEVWSTRAGVPSSCACVLTFATSSRRRHVVVPHHPTDRPC